MRLRSVLCNLLAASLVLMLAALFPFNASAQGDDNESRFPVARKFDDYGMIGGCDHSARLDNFAIQLMSDARMTGYIVSYGPEGEGSGTGEYKLRVTVDYLVNSRGIDPARIKTIYGGRYKSMKETRTELWIAPPDAEPPAIESYENETKAFRGLYEEFNTTDGVGNRGEDFGTGPSSGNVTFANFADAIRLQPEALAYIVVASSPEAAPGAWRRVARELSSMLESSYKIAADRFRIICGGYNAKTDASVHVQLWIVAANGPPPVAEVKAPEPRPERAVQLDSVNDYTMSFEADAQQVFEGFADLLKTDEKLNACVIVRTPVEPKQEKETEEKTAEEKASEEETQVVELPKADLISLVQRWKADLEEKYGIDRNRLVLMIVPAEDEWQSGSLETWVVPAGAQLPNPNTVEEEMVETEEIVTEEVRNEAEENPQE